MESRRSALAFPRAAILLLILAFFCFVARSVGFAEGYGGGGGGGRIDAANKRKKVPVRHQLSLDFYNATCPHVDQLVASVTAQRFRNMPAAGAATIRLFFHDCFVEGCDGSILIAASSGGGKAVVERDMEENQSLAVEAFETVEMAKAAVESKCPGLVTCADILAIAARDFVHLAGGPNYAVKKGRKDSRVSLAGKVKRNLPRANSTVDDLHRLFAAKGLSTADLVALSGAHTIGFSHCDQFVSRLYDFRGTAAPDPALDPRFLKALRMSCPRAGGNTDVVAPFDVRTPFAFDHMYYANLEASMGLLATDQALFADPRTRPLVLELGRDKAKFFEAFAAAMDKMGSIRVKKGRTGEIRKVYIKYAPFDVRTPFAFDHMYYANLEASMGLLATDQALFADPRTRPLVLEIGRDKAKFFEAFAAAMDKMGSIRVKKGRTGEIRKVCSKHLSGTIN